MTPDQTSDLDANVFALIRTTDMPTRAAFTAMGRDVMWLISIGDIDVAKYIVQNASNPTGSTLTADQFATLKAQLLALFP